MEGFAFEEKGDNERKDNKGHNLLDDLQLHQTEWTSITGKSKTVGRNLGAIFKERDTP